ncbi:hypothetical protein GN244_ATG02353 [Phytophthora infestans]|uniref:Uncharacterized protein n=1 Tax=Phytophthora infestans TaxID=4787 RepID=A0A833W771_PHYIN|nr:hypothetical protein GN244_ATG02353 [Phytophthora infestans]KAF4133213.1 hypothetical protein GN958_ATG17559 [Phytophthora infestans]
MQRAKRKGHEEAIAAVQAHQRLTQERERAEHEQYQRYQQAQQVNGHRRAIGTSSEPQKPRATGGCQWLSRELVSASQPAICQPLPAQQEAGQAPNQERQYQAPAKWYNAGKGQSRSPLSHGYEANAPRLSSSSFGYDTNYPDSMRYDDPYPTGGGADGVPFMSVTSPSASKSLKANRKNGVKLGAPNSEQEQTPAPVVVPRYTRAPPSPSEARASAGSGASGDTLQARIDALRSADSNDMVHSRTSASEASIQRPRTLNAQESYASGSARRGLMVGSLLSPNSSAMPASPLDSLESARSYETFDTEALESAKSTKLGAVLTYGSSRSIGSDFSHGQFEDAESFGPNERNLKTPNEGKSKRPTRGDNVSFNSRGSVEF